MTANYTAQRDAFGRSVQWVVELTLDRCTLLYGTATAGCGVDADLGDGSRCYYTYTTCQNLSAFNRGTKSYKFCLPDVPWPDDANPAYPLLKKIVSVPQKIDAAHLFTYPGSVQAYFHLDYLPLVPDADKSVRNTSTTGEFWRNLLARNRNYVGRPMKIYRGFYASGFGWSDFAQVGPAMKIKQIQVDRDECVITGESALASLDQRQIPYPISDDNKLQASINSTATTCTVIDASEYPDPASFTRNAAKIFVKIEDEICLLTAVDATAETLTFTRGQWGTTAVEHLLGQKVDHVLCVGANNGTAAPGPDNPVSVLQDMLEFAGIAASDVATTTFDLVESAAWSDDDTFYYRTKPEKVSKLVQGLREARGLCLFVDPSGKYACTVMAPIKSAVDGTITEEKIILGTSEVEEDDEYRITRASFYYDPDTDKDTSGDASDFNRAIIVVDTDLEAANMFGGQKEKQFLDAWIYPAAESSTVRNIARRQISRLRFGVRTFTFEVELKSDEIDVGDEISLTTAACLTAAGASATRTCLVTAREETGENTTRFTAVDLAYAGNFMRVGPNTMAANWSDATTGDKAYGYWGDSGNRLGAENAEGYLLW